MESARQIRALSLLRHACQGCGGSCQGVRVRPVGDAEKAHIEALGAQLAIVDPWEDSALRQVDGQCVFLDDTRRCRIHTTFGAEAKPRICRQYPHVLLETEAELRAGIDPGCYTAWRTWRTEAPRELEAYGAAQVRFDPAQQQPEAALLSLTGRPGATVARLLQTLCPGEPEGREGLPKGLSGRLVSRIQGAGLGTAIEQPDAGPSLRDALRPVVAAFARFDAASPPPWPALDTDQDAWAVETTRRMVFLRLAPQLPVPGSALLVLAGAVACAWADPRPEAFGPALAAWTRGLRAPAFWRALVPQPDVLQWLATGQVA